MKIRKEQQQALTARLTHQLILDLVNHVKEHFPEQCATKNNQILYEQIDETVQRAQKYGLRTERDLYNFANITMIYTPDFDEQKETRWTVAYLTDHNVPSPSTRLDQLYSEIIYRLEVEEHNAAIHKEFYGDDEEEQN